MALNSNALTTLALAKSYLKVPTGETSQDSMIELFINSSSQVLEAECDRFLKKRSGIIEYQDGRGQNIVVLRQWPIIQVSELKVDPQSKFDATSVVASDGYAITDENTAVVRIGTTFPKAHRSVKITYDAGYDTIPSDLEHACLWLVFWYAKIRDAADIGRTSKSKEGESISYLQAAPQDVKDTILRYKRTECVASNLAVYNG